MCIIYSTIKDKTNLLFFFYHDDSFSKSVSATPYDPLSYPVLPPDT